MPDTPAVAPAPTPTAPAAAPSAPNPAQESVAAEFERRDIRRAPEFKKIFKAFEAKAKPTGTLPEPEKETPEPGEVPTPPAKPTKPTTEVEAKSEPKTEPGREGDHPVEPEVEKALGAKGKSPWRVADYWKGRTAELEKKLAETTKGAIPEAQAAEFRERIQKSEARVQELENEIRFANYEKSPDFHEKYHKPYEAAFKRAMAELSEIPVTDAQGNQRPATAEDLLGLVSLPLGKAREVADAAFGPFSDDAMAHRKEIRRLWDERSTALEEAKNTGAAREKQQREQFTRAQEAMGKAVNDLWTSANQEALSDPTYSKYFTPREGVEEWNKRLTKGYELADKGFSDPNPRDPRLTPEQREEIVRRHAAIRNRSAAFGPLRWENSMLQHRIAELEKELKDFKATEPGSTAGAKPKSTPPESGYNLETLFQGIRKYAK